MAQQTGRPAPDVAGPSAPASSGSSGAARPKPRLLWVDAARGYAVLAVVLFHFVQWSFQHWSIDGPLGQGWELVGFVLSAVRMPLLLGVSGLLLARQVREGLHRSTTVYRSVTTYWLFAVWTGVYLLVAVLTPASTWRPRWALEASPEQLVVPDSPLWYLLALALYVLVLAALRRVPPAVVLGVLAVVSVVCAAVQVDTFRTWVSIPQYALFFALGVYGRDTIMRWTSTARWLPVLGLGAGAMVLLAASRIPTVHPVRGLLLTLSSAVALAFAAGFVARAVAWRPFAAVGRYVGQRTLAVYVTHPIVFQLVLWGGDEAPALRHAAVAAVVVLPLLAVALAVGVGLVVDAVARRVGLSFLLELPRPLRTRFGR
ncbi:acyltransferase family protein [Cellulomonas marina]|uniref:Surface polysaccharide O-acyltransferase, integral membrane enzyme n=1 Tax=Cellulomonas marina TaxID=988821 RepID=A0A1I0X0K5_9CELL|nr:acyltransferase family protein [Cellulomonas marina]GIG29354.1 hypothetical protein Cma02nite_19540 [Cellulomonas marina]SFA94421.1 Surface polysaccharide O-acyltransferase, integral membrane enzyme [Cellulomonas marina]